MATGQPSARVALRACQLAFAINLASLAACDTCSRSEPRLRPASELDQDLPLDGGAGLPRSAPQGSPSVQVDAAVQSSEKTVKESLTPEEVLERLLVPELAHWSPEQASAHLAPLGLSREEPLPGSLQLARATTTLRINVHYLPDAAGKFAFADALMELPATTVEQAKRAYRDMASYLATKLGKAAWVKNERDYPTSGYNLGTIKVTLGAVATTKDGLPYVALSLAAPTAN